MISYELAKKLKDSGFIFTSGVPRKIYREDGTIIKGFNDYKEGEEVWMIPNLDELIKSCLYKDILNYFLGSFELLDESYATDIEHIINWRVKIRTNTKDYSADGSTPEEAVAKLWLKLNEK